MKPIHILQATILLSAAASLLMSVWLFFSHDGSADAKLHGIFVGIWVPSILSFGAFLVASIGRGGRDD